MTDKGRRAFLGLLGAAAAGIGIAACTPGGGQNNGGSSAPGTPAPSGAPAPTGTTAPSGAATAAGGSRTLVTYFSMPETDDPNDMTEDEANSTHVVDGKVLGNTQYVAQLIQARTGAEIFRIETAQPMPLEHEALIEQSVREQEEDARPELKALVTDLGAFDTVFIGYPIWNYELPSPVNTFLDQHDFNGKNIVLFSTHGGNQLADTVATITDKLSGSTVNQNGFTISRDDMDRAESEVGSWLEGLN
jgi:flavodoxin